eukprot:8882165-Karenia_brevis.AAC.1
MPYLVVGSIAELVEFATQHHGKQLQAMGAAGGVGMEACPLASKEGEGRQGQGEGQEQANQAKAQASQGGGGPSA